MIGILLPVTALGLMLQPPLNTRSTTPLSGPGTGTRAVVPLRMADGFVESVEDLENKIKEQKTETSTETSTVWPDFDNVRLLDKPLLQALATVCAKLYDPALFAAWTPEDPKQPDNTALDQAYVQSKPGGQYREGGEYTKNGGYTNGAEALVEGIQIFNKDTTQERGGKDYGGTPSLAEYGEAADGFTDFHGKDQAAIPPFAAVVVKPNDEEDNILILAWRGSITAFDFINDVALSPTLSSRWSGATNEDCAHGAYVNLIETHNVKRVFLTGHSLGGGLANVAHLVVRGQLQKAGSPWAKLDGKATWLACTFASPQTIVRKYDTEKIPPKLVSDLDTSSYNFVYGCDAVPRSIGMLKYLGDLLEIVVPEIADDELNQAVNKLSFAKKWAARAALHELNPEQKLEDADQNAVKLLKGKGLSEVVAQFTHIGMVVYQAPEANEYEYLDNKANIDEVLDVNGPAFTKLLGDKENYAKSLLDAHSDSFSRYKFAGK